MESVNKISSFQCLKFASRVYSPLCLCFVDSEAEKLFSLCGVKFSDFFSAICAKMETPMRAIDIMMLQEQKQEAFFNNVKEELTKFGDCFLHKDFEKNGTTDLSKVPSGSGMPDKFNFMSKHAMNPIWYQKFIEELVNSQRFAEFEFCDLPICVIYVTAPDTSVFSRDTIPQMLPLPTWMLEFFKKIPVVNLFVYDGMVSSKVPDSFKKEDFDLSLPLPVRSRKSKEDAKANKEMFTDIFSRNSEIVASIIKANWIGKTEVDATKEVIERIRKEVVIPTINKSIQQLLQTIENSKKMSNVLKGFFKKKEPEQTTTVLSIPIKKIVYLQLASLYMITENYVEAEKNFKLFASMIEDAYLYKIKLRSLFHAMVCNFINTKSVANKADYKAIMEQIATANSVRLMLEVPLLYAEFCFYANDFDLMSEILFHTISTIKNLWKGNIPIREMILALIFDRVAGITKNPRHVLYYYSCASEKYTVIQQFGHVTRCIIWLQQNLTNKSWPLLYQGALLQKSVSLSMSKQSARALIECKNLLEMEDLQPELQEQVISQFWTPFNDPKLDCEKDGIKFSTLVTVESASAIGPSSPEYWGFESDKFSDILNDFNKVVKREELKNSKESLSYHSWMSDEMKEEAKPIKISIGSKIQVLLTILNRYSFTVFLKTANIKADYKGPSEKEEKYITNTLNDISVSGAKSIKKEKCQVTFDFTAIEPGTYTLNTFQKNYWGYVNTEIDFPPVILEASNDFPKLKLSVDGLPVKAFQGMCFRFVINVTNDNDFPASGIVVGFDHPHSIAYEGDVQHEENISLIKITEEIKAHDTISIPLIFRAAKMSDNYLHFFVAANNSICSYAEAKVSVAAAGTVSATVIRNTNDTGNNIFKVKFTSQIEGLSIIGISNQKGVLLKTIQAGTPSIIPKGGFSTIIAFSQEESSETVEPWRIFMMGGSSYAILFKVEGRELSAQQNLRLPYEPEKRFILSMPNNSSEPLGTRISCKVKFTNQEDIFIQPMLIDLANDEKNSSSIVMSARWVGKTRKRLCKENGYEAEFFFVALLPGVYIVPGFLYSTKLDFSDVHEVLLRHSIHVLPK